MFPRTLGINPSPQILPGDNWFFSFRLQSTKPVVTVRPVQTLRSRPLTTAPPLQHLVPSLNFPLNSLLRVGVQVPTQTNGTADTRAMTAASLNLLPTACQSQMTSQCQGVVTIDVDELVSPTKTAYSSNVDRVNPNSVVCHVPQQPPSQLAAGVPSASIYNFLLNQTSTSQAFSSTLHAPSLNASQQVVAPIITTDTHVSPGGTSQIASAPANQAVVSNAQLLQALMTPNATVQQSLQPSAHVEGCTSENERPTIASPQKGISLSGTESHL